MADGKDGEAGGWIHGLGGAEDGRGEGEGMEQGE